MRTPKKNSEQEQHTSGLPSPILNLYKKKQKQKQTEKQKTDMSYLPPNYLSCCYCHSIKINMVHRVEPQDPSEVWF